MTFHIIAERVHIAQELSFSFQRAGHIAHGGNKAVNFGALPVHRVLDYPNSFPLEWREPGAVFVPLMQDETIWLGFACPKDKPHSVQIAVSDLNAITGLTWTRRLSGVPQNYLVAPAQTRWSGIRLGDRLVPFAPAALTNIDGSEKPWLLLAYRCRPECVRPNLSLPTRLKPEPLYKPEELPGGQAYPVLVIDPFGVQCWQEPAEDTVYIHTVTGRQYQTITGLAPPRPRTSSEVFTGRRLP